MARRIPDLHPDDYTTRIELRAQLRRIREAAGLSQRDMKPLLGFDQGTISKMERLGVEQAKTATVARWARALGHRLTLTPTGFPPPVRWRRQSRGNDPVAGLLSALAGTGAGEGAVFGGSDEWLAARTLNDLVGIRVACAVSQERLAQVLGISEAAISLTELGTADNQLVTLQRYARAVARVSRYRCGYLAVSLDPIPTTSPYSGDTA
jgi:transcriptional regulator with XRE-family HTH domain